MREVQFKNAPALIDSSSPGSSTSTRSEQSWKALGWMALTDPWTRTRVTSLGTVDDVKCVSAVNVGGL